MRYRFKTLGFVLFLGLSAFTLGCALTETKTAEDTGVQIPNLDVSQEVAITIDDLPYVMPSRTTPQAGLSYVQQVNRTLRDHGITATGFAIGQQLKPDTLPALRAFAKAGHIIGNHSWSHPSFDDLTIKEFRDETLRANRALSEWMGTNRYYRFPYLKEGKSEAAKSAATQVLDDLGYQNVPVTIDNDDWRFNGDYLDAIERGDTDAAREIAERYLAHMKERTAFFQRLAHVSFGRDVRHVLLLHMNRINADHLETLLDWYASEGWSFISLKRALADPLYAAPDAYAGPRGLSQIERVLGRKSE